jgi:hypothetical protein
MPGKPSAKDLEVADAMRKIEGIRVERAKEDSGMGKPNRSASKLIGFLKDDPESAEAIGQAIRERRDAMYGG